MLSLVGSLLTGAVDKFVARYAKTPVASARASTSAPVNDYGYALPLGRGIEKMPMPSFEIPAVLDVRGPALLVKR